MKKFKTNPKELDFEEISLSHLKEKNLEGDRLELSLTNSTFFTVSLIVIIISGIVIAGLFFLNVVKAKLWQSQSLANVNKIIPIRANRGIIFAKTGEALVENIPRFDVYLLPILLPYEPISRKNIIETFKKELNISSEEWNKLIEENKDPSIILLKRNLPLEKVILLKSLDLKGIRIEQNTIRHYLDSPKFGHILGYTGSVAKEDLIKNPRLNLNDSVGKIGLEDYDDDFLRGENGEINLKRDAKSNLLEETLIQEPVSGFQIYTTIDAGLQKFAYDVLQNRLRNLGKKAGVVIILNPQNGQVLSLVSLPSFDNNVFYSEDSKIITSILNSGDKPMFNRAISGFYSPGSTIKPLVAYGALNEGLIDDKTIIYSPGFLEVPNPFHPDQPSIFLDWKPHGNVNLYSALARSSNVYFYSIGGGTPTQKGLGIEKLKSYWQKFGLGSLTNIDLTGETKGLLADPQTKPASEPWRLGDTYNVSIGQGNLLLTPIQLINYITAFANGGKIYQPYIVGEIKDENNKLIKENKPKILYTIDNPQILNLVKLGLIDAVRESYGTAHSLDDLPISVAAKTGTAQIANESKINAIFVGFAPVENPQIAVLVLIEDAQEGSLNALPVAEEIFLWYHKNRLQ